VDVADDLPKRFGMSPSAPISQHFSDQMDTLRMKAVERAAQAMVAK
jgi:hypothetical protein